MDRVLELLSAVAPDSAKVAAELLTKDLLGSSTAQQKHKLKTRISALLKSSGPTRAVGAVLARKALVDWSIVKTHGPVWAPILLHVLDLPDSVGWAPVVKTLTFLYAQVHGKPDLSREIAGSKIGEFMKRLVKVLPTLKDGSPCVGLMISLYPTQCRPYLNKLAPVLDIPGAEQAYASLCLAEKTGSEVWTKRVSDLLAQLEAGSSSAGPAASAAGSELVLSHQYALLREYMFVAPALKAKVPASRLVNLLNTELKSFKPTGTVQALNFMLATCDLLGPLYIQSFDTLLYSLIDSVDLGYDIAISVAKFLAWEIRSVGWLSENYTKAVTRLTRKIFAVAEKRGAPVGYEGLADYVQNANNFIDTSLADSEDLKAITDYFTAVVFCVPEIPQSIRSRVESFILAQGSIDQVAAATLYPGRFSILPLTIEKFPTLDRLETLVHPRFPPLNISKHTLLQREQPADDELLPTPADETVNEIVAEDSNDMVTENQAAEGAHQEDSGKTEDIEIAQLIEPEQVLPPIPESTKPLRHVEFETPPEKRLRLSESEPENEPEIEPEIELEPRAIDEPAGSASNNEDAIDDDDDLVIPALTLDSDSD